MTDFTADEVKLISKFRQNVSDIKREEISDDYYLIRWLRARDGDLKKAEKMLRDHVEWRQREQIDTILEDFEPPEVIKKYYSGGFCGQDKEGRPLWVEPIGQNDTKGLIRSATKEETLRARVQTLEYVHKVLLPQQSKALGRRVTQTVVLLDLTDFGMRHMWGPSMQYITEYARISDANYPETLRHLFVINAPFLFPLAYKIVAPFLAEATIKKIQILGSNYQEVLLRYFNKEDLPACFGGTLTDPDGNPRCPSKINWGGEIPEKYYLQCSTHYMQEATVSRRSSLKLEFQVTRPGSRLHWEFQTEHHDIGFTVVLKKSPSSHHTSSESPQKEDVLVPLRRCNSNLVREKGELEISQPGHVVVKFDNTYSWSRSKRLWHRVELQEALEHHTEECDSADSGLGK